MFRKLSYLPSQSKIHNVNETQLLERVPYTLLFKVSNNSEKKATIAFAIRKIKT